MHFNVSGVLDFCEPGCCVHSAHAHSFVAELPLDCSNASTVYVRAVHACLPIETAQSTAVKHALVEIKQCPGGVFTNNDMLQRLRFCTHITGPLVIQSVTGAIDISVLWDIEELQGVLERKSSLQ